jgi:hypothetical protein
MLLLGELGSKEAAMTANVRRFLAAVPAVTIALISHAGGCLACWPLIGGVMSSLGLTFLVETRYLLPLMIVCLAIAVAALSSGAQRNYRPLVLGFVASGLILIGRFVLGTPPITIGGACLLMGASIWSFWLRRSSKASVCESCASPKTAEAEPIIPTERITNIDTPIACALNQAQFAERKRLVDRLAQNATERRSLPNGVGLYFEAISGRVTELAKFVDLERACCPLLTFRIDAQPGKPVWLELTGPVAAQEIIRELIPKIASNR